MGHGCSHYLFFSIVNFMLFKKGKASKSLFLCDRGGGSVGVWWKYLQSVFLDRLPEVISFEKMEGYMVQLQFVCSHIHPR